MIRFVMLLCAALAPPFLVSAWAQQYPGQGQPINGVATNRGTALTIVTITTGLTFQTVVSASTQLTQRQSLTVQNNNINSDNCWVSIGAASAVPTTPTSILLGQGGSYGRYFPYVPSDRIAATCTTTGDSLYVDSQ